MQSVFDDEGPARPMPVILTRPAAYEVWLTDSWPEAARLQRPLPDCALAIVARGAKTDFAGERLLVG